MSPTMALPSGTRLGPYEVIAAVGAGGMGEVYKAIDTRLDRTVAVKVISAHMSDDPEQRARLEREARSISSLNHPHICTLYDIGSQNGVDFLVMEYLEGETLATRLRRGRLSPAEVLQIAIAMAEGLGKAHEKGIVHRDMKPGNVMLTRTGVKIMDFGLAKLHGDSAADDEGRAGMAKNIPADATISAITSAGVVMGTVQYMSPEQLQGNAVDSRSDIFAFGCILYEMNAGRKPFDGKSMFTIAGAILEKDPEQISALQPGIPPALEHVIRTCMAKAPQDRWQDIADVRRDLIWIRDSGAQLSLPAARKGSLRERILWTTALLATLAIAALVYFMNRPAPAVEVMSSIDFPESASLDRLGSFAISPDGRQLAYVATDQAGKYFLWVRHLNSLAGQPLMDTEGASYPFWSPDSSAIAFFTPGKLKRIEAGGGPSQTICDAADGRGGAWNRNGVIVFNPDSGGGGLWRVSATGGAPAQLPTRLPGTSFMRWPQFLPDDEHFLFFSFASQSGQSGSRGIYQGSLSRSNTRFITAADTMGRYASGYLLYGHRGKLMAQAASDSLSLKGEASPLVERINSDSARYYTMFSVSRGGLMVFEAQDDSKVQWSWFDRNGKLAGTLGELADYIKADPSPDGKMALLTRSDTNGGYSHWLLDLNRKIISRFSFGDRGGSEYGGVWSPDSRYVAFASDREVPDRYDLYYNSVSGSQPEQRVLKLDFSSVPFDWSRDGLLAYITATPDNKDDIAVIAMQGERKSATLVQTKSNDDTPRFSADGNWFSYESDVSGRYEVYLAAVKAPERRWQISKNGGVDGHFCASAREFLYRNPEDKVISVDLDTSAAEPKIGESREAFPSLTLGNFVNPVPSRDCSRMLAGVRHKIAAPRITLFSNWTAHFKAQ